MAKAEMNWYSGMLFFSKTTSGHDLVIDAAEVVGGKDAGPRPKELILYSLMGCTGMDVVSLLRKMRVIENLESFKMEIEYENAQEHPKVYTKIHLKYIFKFNGEPPAASHPSAINLRSCKIGSSEISFNKDKSPNHFPSGVLPKTAARSNLKPSTCISVAQYLKLSIIISLTTGWLQFKVFPQPL